MGDGGGEADRQQQETPATSPLLHLSSTSYITTAFTLASSQPGLEIKILHYCGLHSPVQ